MMRLLAIGLAVAGVAAAKDFRVQFNVETTTGPASFIVRVHEEWAPIGAARFKEAVEAGFYDDTRFFRVIPSFMVQFGLSGNAATSASWRSKTISDEPVKVDRPQLPNDGLERRHAEGLQVSNKPGYITFAKTGAPNSRTTQLFINYGLALVLPSPA